MTQKEFKTTMLAQLNAALETARDFDKDDLSEIESLRSGINYQVRQQAYAPCYKSEAELKVYQKEIKEKINELKCEINSVYRKYGWIVIQFPNDKGQYRIVNTRQEIQRVIGKVKGLTDVKLQPKKYVFRTENPAAAKFEIFEGIVKINKEGWFSDGHVLLKGEAPKDAELIYPDKKPAEVDWMLNLEGNPARLLYYFFDHFKETERQYVSDRPLPTFHYKNSGCNSIDPSVAFESNGKFWCYNQNKYNFIINRHPVDRYEIVYDVKNYHIGYLRFFIGDEIVGLMMPYRPDGSDNLYLTEPPLKEMVIKTGLIKPKEVVLPYTGRRLENQLGLGL